MLYFRFNTDKFIAPLHKCETTNLDSDENRTSSTEILPFDLGQISLLFFRELEEKYSLPVNGMNHLYYDIVDIPLDAFSIDDESVGNYSNVINCLLSKHRKQPIKVIGKSLAELGIDIEFCKHISNHELHEKVGQFAEESGMTCLNEDVLWQNMSSIEKAGKFAEYLEAISSDGNELIIVDPYLFSSKEPTYYKMLAAILNSSKASEIIAITDKRHYYEECFSEVASKVCIPISVSDSQDFHDRFWIAKRQKGFCTGTSLNGVGKRFSLINYLPEDDVAYLVNELDSRKLI